MVVVCLWRIQAPYPAHSGVVPCTVQYFDGRTVRPQIMMVDAERGAIVVKGSVPGKPGNILEITPAKQVGKNC